MEAPRVMDPLRRARYDAAVQRYHDAVAIHREKFESELRKAGETIDELNRRQSSRPRRKKSGVRSDDRAEGGHGASSFTGPVNSILNR